MYPIDSRWLALAALSGRFDPWPLLDALGPDALARAPIPLLQAHGLPLPVAARLAQPPPPRKLPVPWVRVGGPGYPEALRRAPFAPPVLFYEGDLSVLDRPAVALVGSRSCTAYGTRWARELARGITAAGGVVVSGLARGIDTAAHEAAVELGPAVGVLGHGLRAGWRVAERALAGRILRAGGLLLSEFPPEQPAARWTFPQRNRVIAGLSRLTVVVEAGHRSGARITARHAVELGRELAALPGPVGEGRSEGCLDLIESGAHLVRGLDTVLRLAGLAPSRQRGGDAALPPLLRLLGEGATLEQLAERSGRSFLELLQELSQLEARGLVERAPGQRYYPRH